MYPHLCDALEDGGLGFDYRQVEQRVPPVLQQCCGVPSFQIHEQGLDLGHTCPLCTYIYIYTLYGFHEPPACCQV